MQISSTTAIIMIAVAAICTFATRLVPFLIFRGEKELPKTVKYLGNVLPVAIIGVLIVFCIGDFRTDGLYALLPKMIAAALTAAVHIWKHNVLLSISVGTIGYMLLIHFVF